MCFIYLGTLKSSTPMTPTLIQNWVVNLNNLSRECGCACFLFSACEGPCSAISSRELPASRQGRSNVFLFYYELEASGRRSSWISTRTARGIKDRVGKIEESGRWFLAIEEKLMALAGSLKGPATKRLLWSTVAKDLVVPVTASHLLHVTHFWFAVSVFLGYPCHLLLPCLFSFGLWPHKPGWCSFGSCDVRVGLHYWGSHELDHFSKLINFYTHLDNTSHLFS